MDVQQSLDANKRVLHTTDISFGYHNVSVLHDIDFELFEGEICSIIGPNGAGKTTFLNVLSGRVIPQKGKIFCDGQDITRVPPHKRRELGISRSFQVLNIFDELTVFENARLAVQGVHKKTYSFWKAADSYDDLNEKTLELLELTHLLDKKDIVCSDLAYAEKRLVEIALTMAGNPKIILFDEPTAGLSVEESIYTAQFIKKLSKELKLSILFIEHDMDIVFDISDRIAVLYYGQMIAADAPEKVRQNKQVQEIYLGAD